MNVTETLWLKGKVAVQELPLFDPAKEQCPPLLKRLVLTKGELAQFHDSETSIRYMAFLELRAGQERGNHFHRMKEEHVYLAAGKMLLKIRDLGTQEHAELNLEGGTLVRMDPGVAHVLVPLTDGYAVEFSPERFDPIDIHPYPFSGT